MIRKAILVEIPEIINITKMCATKMNAEGIFQWNEHYPNAETFKKDIAREELFVFIIEEKIVGCITISHLKDKEYNEINWLTPDGHNLYIHRLAIDPYFQHQGFAKQLMDFAENLALETKTHSIRLDTFSRNKRNQRFYEARGYKRLGNIYFPKQSEYPFYCYELIFNTISPKKNTR